MIMQVPAEAKTLLPYLISSNIICVHGYKKITPSILVHQLEIRILRSNVVMRVFVVILFSVTFL